MKTILARFFEASTCLSKRQLRDYVQGVMSREEKHVTEHHISSCNLCAEALEGIMASPHDATDMLETLDTDFLQEHFRMTSPQVHVNSMAPVIPARRRKYKTKHLLRTSGIVMLLAGISLTAWYLKSKENFLVVTQPIITNENHQKPASAPPDPAPAPVSASIVAADTPTLSATTAPPAAPATIKEAGRKPAPATVTITEKEPDEDQSNPGTTQTIPTEHRADDREIVNKRPAAPTTANEAILLYESGAYAEALRFYLLQMQDKDRHSRDEARLMAARCYLGMGQETKAISLLQALIHESSGSQKRQAKRLLRSIDRE